MLRASLFGERPAAEVVIGNYGDESTGFALFFHNFSTFLGRPGIHLEDLYVTPGLGGRGIVRAMLAYFAKLVKERGCGWLEWSALDWNEPAIRLYESIGAGPMDDRKVYRATGEVLDCWPPGVAPASVRPCARHRRLVTL